MIFRDFIRQLIEEVPDEWWDVDVTIEGMDWRGRKAITIDLDESPEQVDVVHIVGTDLPIEQFPYNLYGPRRKPYNWDEYKALKKKGLFPTGHEDLV